MQRKSWADANCPMARSVDLIGEWGSLLILREAFGGVRRFDDFQKQIGISRNLLTTRLKKLVDGGVLERRPVCDDHCVAAMGGPVAISKRKLSSRHVRWPGSIARCSHRGTL